MARDSTGQKPYLLICPLTSSRLEASLYSIGVLVTLFLKTWLYKMDVSRFTIWHYNIRNVLQAFFSSVL